MAALADLRASWHFRALYKLIVTRQEQALGPCPCLVKMALPRGILFITFVGTIFGSQPLTMLNVLDGLSKEGAKQFKRLGKAQRESTMAELQALNAQLQDARSFRFAASGEVRHSARMT